jgi:diguanylate cyclase (GGDEF)-like protein
MTTNDPPAPRPDGLELLEQAGQAGSWQWLDRSDTEPALLRWTPALARLLQWDTTESPPWRHPCDLLASECRGDLQTLMQATTSDGDSLELETLALTAGGMKLPARLLLRCQAAAGGLLWQGVLQDRSEHRQRQQQTRREQMQLSTTLASMTAAFATMTPDGRLSYLNPPACRLLERQAWQLLGRRLWHELDDSGGSAHWVAVGRDITARKAQEEVIEHLAFHDPLTGLPNRQLLMVRLQQALAQAAAGARIGALLFIDLDHFKLLNDTLGHDRGDELLQQVAARLRACVREGDTVARLGGDEFVVVMHELAERPAQASERARQAATLILRTLGQPYELANQPYHGTCSIGITLLRDHENSLPDLLKQADLAMYQAKAAGRNTLCFFDPQMQAAALAKAALSSALRQALHEQQFVLHYQPQVLASGQVIGVEALLRWRLPTGELRGPDSFIAQAEESGLILPLGQWVIEQACRQLALWAGQAHLRSLTLSVNVSTRQFLQPSFVEQVLQAVARHGVQAQQIELEITESLLATDLEGTIARMRLLRQAGLGLAIDDFGMGYSALSCLKHMPLQRLKIDRSFVTDMAGDPRDAAIARTIVQLARNLGLQVTAEGVETAEQLQMLSEAGCRVFQGFLFSPALPVEQLEAFVQEAAVATL